MRKFVREQKDNLIVILLVSFIVSLCTFSYFFYDSQQILLKKQEENEKKQQEMEERLKKVSDAIETIGEAQFNLQNRINEVQEKQSKVTFNGPVARQDIPSLSFSSDSDLKAEAPTLTVSDMNKLIEEWDRRAGGNTGLIGKGNAFIVASQKTGYNPVYLLAHAAVESGWGTSNFAVSRGNLYGIGAFDSNPNNAFTMGDTIDDGIVNGGMWIDENFYTGRNTRTLNEMFEANYASNPSWASQISTIVNTSYRILSENII
jgi:beta-N-acetylglucosaminidase